MKLWKIAATVALGVFASGSGALQVNAATYAYQVDFIDKEVADFDDFKQSFNANTYALNAKLDWTWSGTYYFDTTTNLTVNITWFVNYQLNGTGGFIQLLSIPLPDFQTTTTPTLYTAFGTVNIPDNIVLALVNDDANYVDFQSVVLLPRINMIGNTLNLENYTSYFNVYYEFDTTYLFNYFLSDQQFISRTVSAPSFWTFNSTLFNFLEYVYTTAGNDTYLIENSLQVDIGTTRKKYAINVDDVYFRGESVGAQFRTQNAFGLDKLTPTTTGNERLTFTYRYYFLNTSNYQQNIANVPTFEFETEDCGGFLAVNVACFVNNALAYIVNDAPVISDAFTLLNAGMRLGGQAFGIIGNFTTDNLFGVMILGGLGITAVRWFLKND
jgi:hypothetical protein